MATFNPNVPDINPANTSFWARPAPEPKVDISKGTLYQGMGKSFDEAVEGVDDWIKHGLIQPIEETDLGNKRNEFADALNSAKAYIEQGTGYTSGDKPTLMPSGENMPTSVANVGDRIQTLHDAMTGGHLSETKYYGDVDNYLRRLRTMFPGYRDFIDQEAFRITGVHPANAEIRSQINDLNRLLSESSESKDKWHTQILAHAKYFSGDEIAYMNKLHAEHPDKFGLDQLAVEVANRAHEEFQLQIDKAEYEQGQRTATEQGKSALTLFNDEARRQVNQFMRFGTIAALGNVSPQQFIEDYSTGKIPRMPSDQAALAATQIQAKIAAITSNLSSFANEPHGDKPSIMNALKGQTDQSYDNALATQLKPLVEFRDLIHKGAADIATLTKAQYDGIEADNRVKLDKHDQETGGMGAKNEWISKNLGTQGQALWFQKNFPKINKAVDDILPVDLTNALYQPGLREGGDHHVTTMKEAFDDIKKRRGPDKAYDEIMSWHKLLINKDTSPEARVNLVHFFYSASDQNWAVLRDHNLANPERLYQQLFDPVTSKTIAKLGPEAWQEYQGAASALASTVFGKNFQTLASYQNSPDVKFGWHSDSGIDVLPGESVGQDIGRRMKNVFTGNVPEINMAKAKEAQKQINTVYQGLKAVFDHSPQKKEGEDAETTMIDMMLERGFNPNIPGIPADIMKNIIAAHSKAAMPEGFK